MDRSQDGPDHWACDRYLGKLESDGAGVAHDAGPHLDQFQLQAGQRPVGHGLGQLDAAQKCCQVVGQRVQLQPNLVVAEPLARQPGPAESVFTLLDVLLGGAASIVEAGDLVRLHGKVGDDEADLREQLARMPFDLGNDPARPVPGCGMILELLVKPIHLGL